MLQFAVLVVCGVVYHSGVLVCSLARFCCPSLELHIIVVVCILVMSLSCALSVSCGALLLVSSLLCMWCPSLVFRIMCSSCLVRHLVVVS